MRALGNTRVTTGHQPTDPWAEQHTDLKARAFLSAGEREVLDPFGIASNTVRLAEKLSGRRYPGLQLETWIVPEASHVRTAAPSLARALGFFAASRWP